MVKFKNVWLCGMGFVLATSTLAQAKYKVPDDVKSFGTKKSNYVFYNQDADKDGKLTLEEFKNGRQLFSEGALFNDTVRRFKGLQAPCVILTEVDFEDFDDAARSLLYLGMTRASMSLKMVIAEAFAEKLAACL